MSPLALLAATCSKIGSSQEHLQGQGQRGKPAQQQVKVVSNGISTALLQHIQQQNQQLDTSPKVAVPQHSPSALRDPLAASPSPPQIHHQQPQVITLAQLQNLLPLQQVSAANSDIGQLQGQTVKTFVSSSAGLTTPTVVSVQGVPGQYFQVSQEFHKNILFDNMIIINFNSLKLVCIVEVNLSYI